MKHILIAFFGGLLFPFSPSSSDLRKEIETIKSDAAIEIAEVKAKATDEINTHRKNTADDIQLLFDEVLEKNKKLNELAQSEIAAKRKELDKSDYSTYQKDQIIKKIEYDFYQLTKGNENAYETQIKGKEKALELQIGSIEKSAEMKIHSIETLAEAKINQLEKQIKETEAH